MKKYLLLFFILTCSISKAQVIRVDTTTKWRKSFKSGLNLNQASFSSNWKAGGVNSIGFTTFLNYKANFKSEKTLWDNEIDLLYGMVNNTGQGYRKTLDRIFLDIKVGHKLNKHWDMFVAMNFFTQFARGYKYTKDLNGVEQSSLISSFFAPAFFTTSAGIEYHPKNYFKLRLAPVAPRLTFVKNSANYIAVDPLAPYGVKIGKTIRYEWLSAQLLSEFNKDIVANIHLKVRYLVFANYENFQYKKIDQRFDLNLTAKVTKFVNVSVGSILLYDYDQDSKVQFNQAFSLGVLYTFQNFK